MELLVHFSILLHMLVVSLHNKHCLAYDVDYIMARLDILEQQHAVRLTENKAFKHKLDELVKTVDKIQSADSQSSAKAVVRTNNVDIDSEFHAIVMRALQKEKKKNSEVKIALTELENELVRLESDSNIMTKELKSTMALTRNLMDDKLNLVMSKVDECVAKINENDGKIDSVELKLNEALQSTIVHTRKLVDDKVDLVMPKLEESIAKMNQNDNLLNGRIDSVEERMNEKLSALKKELDEHLPDTVAENTLKTTNETIRFESCQQIAKCKKGIAIDGVAQVYPYDDDRKVSVFCDQTIDGGGWTVFQRRKDGTVDFYRDWESYKTGFGDLNGELWLGNEYLSVLTAEGEHELRVDMIDFEGNTAYAKYAKFKVSGEEDNYRLTVDGYTGDAGDSLVYHNGMPFSTKDRGSDMHGRACSRSWRAGWWYNDCFRSHLNGVYHQGENSPMECISWRHWKGYYYSLKFVEMKLR